MTVTGTEIQVRAFPQASATRVVALGGLLVFALAVGFLVGRVTAPGSEATTVTAPQPLISTTWLDDTPAIRQEIMYRMNGIPVETSAYIDSAALPLRVMEHANELSGPGNSHPEGIPVGLRVMRHMNQILSSGSS